MEEQWWKGGGLFTNRRAFIDDQSRPMVGWIHVLVKWTLKRVNLCTEDQNGKKTEWTGAIFRGISNLPWIEKSSWANIFVIISSFKHISVCWHMYIQKRGKQNLYTIQPLHLLGQNSLRLFKLRLILHPFTCSTEQWERDYQFKMDYVIWIHGDHM